MQPASCFKVTSARAKESFELMRNTIHPPETLIRKADHHDGVILASFGEATSCNIAITDGFHLKHVECSADVIEATIQRFQKAKNLLRFSLGTPRSEASNINECNSAMRKEVCDDSSLSAALVIFDKLGKVGCSCIVAIDLLVETVSHVLRKERCHNVVGTHSRFHNFFLPHPHTNIVQGEDKGGKEKNKGSDSRIYKWFLGLV
mmetsp:Transcript_16620/g.31612  ORF Transcript_16620/g.31612 Transcript_16620/m.31612 type:complete len:204 (-) Transcript_16620:1572-2183(-)